MKSIAMLIMTSLASIMFSCSAYANDFLGINFGVGVALSIDASKGKERIETANIINGIVRVEEERDAMARVILESHYFFEPASEFPIGKVSKVNWGHGPFLAIQPGDNDIVNSIGFGWMWGFKRGNNGNVQESWNFGLGIMVDPNARVLGDGIVKNQPLPVGETAIRYKSEAETSVIAMFSFTF